jgi:hypothetical protein
MKGASKKQQRQIRVQRIEGVVVQRYTEDEIEAGLQYHNSGGFEHDVYKDLRDVWIRHWLPDHEQKRLGSIQKGESK